jgi:hypothetical protein
VIPTPHTLQVRDRANAAGCLRRDDRGKAWEPLHYEEGAQRTSLGNQVEGLEIAARGDVYTSPEKSLNRFRGSLGLFDFHR